LHFAGDTIVGTPEHPFFVNNDWLPAKELKRGDSLFTFSGCKVAIDSIFAFRTDTATAVYNLEASGNHNYYVSASGVLVHNCNTAQWSFGKFKSPLKWANQMAKRGWTTKQINEAIKSGKQFDAINMVNKGNRAIRYVHPKTGKSVVRDEVTKEILQIGGEGFKW